MIALRLSNVAGVLGTLLKWFSLVFAVPIGLALWHGTSPIPFVIPLGTSLVLGIVLERLYGDGDLRTADGFLLVVLSWTGVSLLGAIPYIVADVGTLADPMNAIFESVSGFTGTGSTVLGVISVEQHGHAIMMWRQMTQWLGGMGILVLAVAILPRLAIGGAQFLDHEVPGPRMDRLTPHIAETARRLFLLYVGFSLLLLLILLGIHYTGVDPVMDPFNAVAHVMTTMPSGGFSPEADSVGAFSPTVQWVLIPFMLVAGMNFALLWRAIFTGPGELVQNTEFKVYIAIFTIGGLFIGIMLLLEDYYPGVHDNLRHGFFQITTIATSTGYASTDFAQWPGGLLAAFFMVFFCFGCIGSTSGGLKVFRWVVGIKAVHRELFQRIHPAIVRPLRMGRRALKSDMVQGAIMLIVIYLTIFALAVVVVTVDTHLAGVEMDAIDVISSVAATLGNIGPGLGRVGPMENFEFLPDLTKTLMCFLMIAGRLEIMTLLVVLLPKYWKN